MADSIPVKIALLSDCYLPRLGGIEVQVHDLAGSLTAAGHHVEVFTATMGAKGEARGDVEDVDGVAVHRMAARMPGKLPVNPLAPKEVRRRLQERGFDVAHVHMGVVSPFATDMAALTLDLGVPTAITWHCIIDRAQPLFRRLGTARGWAQRGAALSAVSSAARDCLLPVTGDDVDVRVLPNGIDPAAWRRPSGRRRPADGVVRVVTATRLAPRKRPRAVVEIVRQARELVPGRPSMQLEILGEGSERGRIERYLSRHELDWVHLPGRLTRPQLAERYWDADIYIAPARVEAFGLAALEARTAGLPIVSVAGTGVDDFVEDGVSGLRSTDDLDMAHTLARLVEDTSLRQSIRRHNLTTAPEQSWSRVVQQVEQEYARARSLRAVARR